MKILIYPIFLILFIQSVYAQVSSVRMYAFGHSLIDHATSFEGTNIMYWINDISQEAGYSFATGGQYGFLPTHDDLPPSSNWGYSGITSVWDSSVEPFSDADVNTLLITAANFIQYVLTTDPHPLGNTTTVIQSTETIFDWVDSQEENVRYYIYANWPEMDLASAFPPTAPLQSEIDDFHNTTIGSFTDWWIDYQNEMLSTRPQLNSRLIPVGMIISKILRDLIPNQIPFGSLYEDSAPHGRESIYFLAGMITYMAVYEQNIPNSYTPNSTVHSVIINNLSTIKDFVWSELNNFNLSNGDSRVFYSTTLNFTQINFEMEDITIYPNPAKNYFKVQNSNGNSFEITVYNSLGSVTQKIKNVNSNKKIDIESLQNGIYFISIMNTVTDKVLMKKLILNR